MAALQPLKIITQPALARHTATIIFIHGLGDSGAGWKPVAEMLGQSLPHVKWILPSARMQPVTINMGMPSPSWFDIKSLDKIDGEEDEAGLLKSSQELNSIITAEVDSGIPSNRIVLGGFSQGAALTLLTGLTSERKLAGLIVLSGYVPIRSKTKLMQTDHAKSLPVFMGHGTADTVLNYKFGKGSADLLTTEWGLSKASEDGSPIGILFKTYEGLPHSVDGEELDDVTSWLGRVIPP